MNSERQNMGTPLELLVKLWEASDQFIENPSEANRREFYRALELVKRHQRKRRNSYLLLAAAGIAAVMAFAILVQALNTNQEPESAQGVITEPLVSPTVVELTPTGMPTSVAVQTPDPLTPICGGSVRTPVGDSQQGVFRRDLGLTLYNTENTNGNILNNYIRAVTLDERGVWFGYFPRSEEPRVNGIGQFDRQNWELCGAQGKAIGDNANDIAISGNGDVWVVTDGYGAARFDGQVWHTYSTLDGLSDDRNYEVVIDQNNVVWIATWEGVARFDGIAWGVPYTNSIPDTLVNNHIHTMAFHPTGETWFGYIETGLSRKQGEQWTHYTAETTPDALQSNNVRDILIDGQGNTWVATSGGGVSLFNVETQAWTIYNASNSKLPNDNVKALALDKYDRVWAATESGVMFFDGTDWQSYAAIDTLDIAFGPACDTCPYNDEHVWLATTEGLTHSRIPQPSPVIEIISVDYPEEVSPNQRFVPEITVKVLDSYELKAGDGLFYAESTEDNLYGAYPVMPVNDAVSAGQTYTFTDSNNPFVAPEAAGTYTSIWRVWASGRYVGEPVVIEFTVSEEVATPQSTR
ncbi:MAG: hypothetical protein K8L91_33185 [Anaerolineae bacterium]|nr:hypothetical protein [Anaerolineae bacterium]